MEAWLGQFVVLFPLWIGIPLIIVLGLTWFIGFYWQKSPKYEWPEDKKKRLAKQKARREALNKVKASLKLKNG